MTPEQFVHDLKASAREGVAATIEYLEAPLGPKPAEHLALLSKWFRGLTKRDQEMVQMAMEYAAEGNLFGLLSVLGNVVGLPSGARESMRCKYEESGKRTRLNDPDGDFLYDLFNNEA